MFIVLKCFYLIPDLTGASIRLKYLNFNEATSFIFHNSLSRSADSTARIWNLADRIDGDKSGCGNPYVLEHVKGRQSDRHRSIASVDWNVSINITFWMIAFIII